jgi:long-chain acyl-CoA synthetase
MGTNNKRKYSSGLTLPEVLEKNVQHFPGRVAQWWLSGETSEKITYKQLGTIVKNISCGLMASGFEKGDRAGIFSPTNRFWAQVDYGIMSAGGITVCIYPTLSSGELLSQINDSGLKILFVDDEIMFEKIKALWGEAKNLEKVVLFRGTSVIENKNVTSLANFMKKGSEFSYLNPGAYEQRRKSVSPDDIMTIVYTSGTTGKPKGVVHTHSSFMFSIHRDLSSIPVLNEKDVLLSVLPLAHTFERQCGHGVALVSGISIAYTTPYTFLEDVQIFRPTIFMAVPRIFKRIYKLIEENSFSSIFNRAIFNTGKNTALKVLDQNEDDQGFIDMSESVNPADKADFLLKVKYKIFDRILYSRVRNAFGGNLRVCFSASATLPAEICRFFLSMGVRVLEGYGSTETCNTITLNRINKILPGSVGAPCPNVENKMAEDNEYLAAGENIFTYYWNNESETKKAFTEDGFFKTGDIVEYAKENYLRIIDRKKGHIVLDTGKTVPSAKIEALFSLSTFIDIIVPYGNDKKILTALVIPDFDKLISYLERKKIDYDKKNMIYENGSCVETGRDFINNQKVLDLIDKEIVEANVKLESWEKIKKYYISSRRLTEKTGELTPTFKVKKNIVFENFKTELESLYL